ncbi:hypothetical protein [Clostridium sp.]|uniref:hypothetical protein n=1 Tax=Clostridium sp. TaxID=1506 RepID=UPI00261040FF|nr:hypothetical protein [Clostridium sp.]
MKYLIIYDNDGTIFSIQGENYKVPNGGVQFIEIEVPANKIIVGVDIETKTVKLADVPLTETEILKKRLEEQENALTELATLLGGGQ